METIRVTSHLHQILTGRFNGTDYVFEPEQPLEVSLEAAQHIFGLGDDDKAGALNKLGLLIPGKHSYADALKQLDQITFEQGRIVYDQELDEDALADGATDDEGSPRRRPGKRTPGRRPHVDRGGEVGGGSPPPTDPPQPGA